MDSTKKIAILGPYLQKDTNSIALHNYLLIQELAKDPKLNIHVITLGDCNKSFFDENVTIHVINRNIKDYPYIPSIFFRLILKIIQINPDIIHAQGTFLPYSTIVALFSKRFTSILTVRGIVAKELIYYRGFQYLFGITIKQFNEKIVLGTIPNIIVTSKHSKEIISKMTNSEIFIIPNGINYSKIQAILGQNDFQHPALLFTGIFTRVKGIDLIIKSVALLKKSGYNLHLYLMGNGPDEDFLRSLAIDLKVENNVHFLGYLRDIDKYRSFKSADIYIQPSRYETFGVVILEAMACGKPVIAADTGGISSLVTHGKTGFLFNSENLEDLVRYIKILVDDKKLQRSMGQKGKEIASEFTWEKSSDLTKIMYYNLLRNR